MSEVAQNTDVESVTDRYDRGDHVGLSVRDIMGELKRAVEAEAGKSHHVNGVDTLTEDSDAIWSSFKGLLEVITALVRECSDGNTRVRENFVVLDAAVKTLTDNLESGQKELTANLKVELQNAAIDTQRASESIVEISAQLNHLQKDFANWQANRSNEAMQNRLEALNARVQLLEVRTEGFAEIKSETRRASGTLSTISEDVESLFGQLAAMSKQINATTTRLETFRRHFEQLPD